MSYVYRHIRLDKNEPFYIRIGSDNVYKRANTTKGRNKIWNDIVNKTDFDVEILLDNISWEQACKKEIEFIKLYGRKIDGGILSNITKGGDGVLGLKNNKLIERNKSGIWKGKKHTEETKLLMSLKSKGVKKTPEAIKKMISSKIGKGMGKNNPKYRGVIYVIDTNKNLKYECDFPLDAAKLCGVSLAYVNNCLCGLANGYKGFYFSRNQETSKKHIWQLQKT
ncbi:MAG: hypothetical protein ACR2IM_05525 [Sediminibacterium sp.]